MADSSEQRRLLVELLALGAEHAQRVPVADHDVLVEVLPGMDPWSISSHGFVVAKAPTRPDSLEVATTSCYE